MLLSKDKHGKVLQECLKILQLELSGKPQDDLEIIDGQLPLLYRLHTELHDGVLDFNAYHLYGWRHGEMIIARAKREKCRLYEAWEYLMRNRFQASLPTN